MKNFAALCLCILAFVSCQKSGNRALDSETASTDSSAIATTIHGFYQWYDAYLRDSTRQMNITKVVNNHNVLDMESLEKHLASIKSSGFVGAEFLENDMAFYKACEKLWQNESADEVGSCMEADKYFCAQDWDLNDWTQSPVRIKSIGEDKAAATLYSTDSWEQNFELKKDNGKWLLTMIECK